MKTKISSLLLLVCFAWLTANYAAAATVPAGTDLIVQTTETVGYTDAPGTKFGLILLKSISAKGHVVLPAGTKLVGKVSTSRRLASSSAKLTVDLAEVIVGGRSVPIKTAGAAPMESYTSSRGVSVARSDYKVPAGRTLHFCIAHPLNF